MISKLLQPSRVTFTGTACHYIEDKEGYQDMRVPLHGLIPAENYRLQHLSK